MHIFLSLFLFLASLYCLHSDERASSSSPSSEKTSTATDTLLFCQSSSELQEPGILKKGRMARLKDKYFNPVRCRLEHQVEEFKEVKKEVDWYRNYLEWIGFGFTGGDGYETKLNIRLKRHKKMPCGTTLSGSIGYLPYELKEPFSDQRTHVFEYVLTLRKPVSPKFYYEASTGLRSYHPNSFLRGWYSSKNQTLESKGLPFLNLGVGYNLKKRLPLIKRPLFLVANYTFSDSYNLPSPDAKGHTRFDSSGFNMGLRVGFRF